MYSKTPKPLRFSGFYLYDGHISTLWLKSAEAQLPTNSKATPKVCIVGCILDFGFERTRTLGEQDRTKTRQRSSKENSNNRVKEIGA